MRYSLLSRFQGTLLAAALGNELGAYSCLGKAVAREGNREAGQTVSLLASTPLTGWHPGISAERDVPSTQTAPWGRAAISCARVLVQAGRWNELEMAAIGIRLGANKTATNVSTGQSRTSSMAAECALATLPLALFFHDNESKQQQLLVQTVRLWQCPPDTEVGLLAIGYAIAQVLHERLERLTLLPYTVAYLKQSTTKPTASLLDLIGALEQVQTLIQQSAGLHTAIEQLQSQATHLDSRVIALAFYCFLSTPDDLRLSLLRAARTGAASPVIGALTGALSGAYNSLNGLPLAWRTGNPTPLMWGLSDREINQVATHLFTVWSGVYNPANTTNFFTIAAPGVIRPR